MIVYYGQKVINKLNEVLSAAIEIGWRFLEMHITNIVLGSVMMLACYDVRNNLYFYLSNVFL